MSITASVNSSLTAARVSSGRFIASVSGASVSASVGTMPVSATVAGGSVAATVMTSPISASAGGGVGPRGADGAPGPQGPAASIALAGDVALSGLTDGDVLRYSSARWRNYADANLTDGGNF